MRSSHKLLVALRRFLYAHVRQVVFQAESKRIASDYSAQWNASLVKAMFPLLKRWNAEKFVTEDTNFHGAWCVGCNKLHRTLTTTVWYKKRTRTHRVISMYVLINNKLQVFHPRRPFPHSPPKARWSLISAQVLAGDRNKQIAARAWNASVLEPLTLSTTILGFRTWLWSPHSWKDQYGSMLGRMECRTVTRGKYQLDTPATR
jgi:hypothetical protein